jgi:hypothetical protein
MGRSKHRGRPSGTHAPVAPAPAEPEIAPPPETNEPEPVEPQEVTAEAGRALLIERSGRLARAVLITFDGTDRRVEESDWTVCPGREFNWNLAKMRERHGRWITKTMGVRRLAPWGQA